MGDIADAMLDGTLCEGCGTYIEGEGAGFPRYCSAQCAEDRGADFTADDRYEPRVPRFNRNSIPKPKAAASQVSCPLCRKAVKVTGLVQHVRDAHPETQEGK